MIKGIVLSIIFGWKVREEKEKIKKREKKIKKLLNRGKRETHNRYPFIIISAFILYTLPRLVPTQKEILSSSLYLI